MNNVCCHIILQAKLYQNVIEDVVNGVRDCFLDEGVDEQVLTELRMLWESKLLNSKAIENGQLPGEMPLSKFTHFDFSVSKV